MTIVWLTAERCIMGYMGQKLWRPHFQLERWLVHSCHVTCILDPGWLLAEVTPFTTQVGDQDWQIITVGITGLRKILSLLNKRFRASSSRKMERDKRDSICNLDRKRLLRRLILSRMKGLKKPIGKPLLTHLCFKSHLTFVSVHPPGTSLDSACHFKSFSCSWILTHFCSSGAVSFLSTSVTSYN